MAHWSRLQVASVISLCDMLMAGIVKLSVLGRPPATAMYDSSCEWTKSEDSVPDSNFTPTADCPGLSDVFAQAACRLPM